MWLDLAGGYDVPLTLLVIGRFQKKIEEFLTATLSFTRNDTNCAISDVVFNLGIGVMAAVNQKKRNQK